MKDHAMNDYAYVYLQQSAGKFYLFVVQQHGKWNEN